MNHLLVPRVMTKLITPYILLYALYVQFHGDYSPGGGFQAGVIFAAAIILYTLIFRIAEAERAIPPRVARVAAVAGLLLYAGVGVVTMMKGGRYLEVGTYRGASFLAALAGNDGKLERAVTVDDWSLTGDEGRDAFDALLSDKETVGGEIEQELAGRVEAFGVRIRSVGLRDLILPGDMKTILNQVILAQKEAEANVIKRREETAAARSQANTAKLLAENPVLAKMKELEMLQDILAGTKTTFVLGRGELAGQIRTLVESDARDEG